MATKPKGPRRGNGAPKQKVRIRKETMRMVKAVALLCGIEPWGDLIDEALQVGVGYIYHRRRMNLATVIPEIPSIWEELDAKDLKTLRGTELPPKGR